MRLQSLASSVAIWTLLLSAVCGRRGHWRHWSGDDDDWEYDDELDSTTTASVKATTNASTIIGMNTNPIGSIVTSTGATVSTTTTTKTSTGANTTVSTNAITSLSKTISTAPSIAMSTKASTAVTTIGKSITSSTTSMTTTATSVGTITITVTAPTTFLTSTVLISVTNTQAQATTITITATPSTITSTTTTTQTITFSSNTQISTVTVPTPAGFTPLGSSLPQLAGTRRKRGVRIEERSLHSLPPSSYHPETGVDSHIPKRRVAPQPPPRFHLPDSFLNSIERRANKRAPAQPSSSAFSSTVITVTVPGRTTVQMVTSTTTIIPVGTRTSTVTVTAKPITTILTSIVLRSTTVKGIVTSTSSYYAACATSNFVSTVNGHPIAGYDPVTNPGTFDLKGYGSDYDCCVMAMTTANGVFWFRSQQNNACWVYSESTCPASAWRGWIVTGSCSVCKEQYTAGNSKCGSVVNEAFTGEL